MLYCYMMQKISKCHSESKVRETQDINPVFYRITESDSYFLKAEDSIFTNLIVGLNSTNLIDVVTSI